jgi:hypothetical protein
MSLLTYLQQISSRLARWKRRRSLPHYTLEELGLSELAITAAELPALTLRQYIDLVSDVPLPTQQQKENFIEYVSRAHSWYKHLPVYPPGVPFYFFIDKYAGCDRLVSEDGAAILQERTEHGHSAYTTAEHRDRFGYLVFSCGFGTKVIFMSKGPMVIPHDDLPAVPGNDGRLYRLPPEVIDAGLTQLTAAIHLHSAFNPLWFRHMPKDSRQIDWPEESGGRLALEKLIERADTIERKGWPGPMDTVDINLPMSGVLKTVDAVLNELLSPERTRQYGEMMKAIDRVCELIAANKK